MPSPWDPSVPGATAQQDSDVGVATRAAVGGNPVLVTGNQQRYRSEFQTTTHPDWDIVIGSGMALANAGGTSPFWSITTGVNTGVTSSFTCKKSFGAPFNTAFGFKLSQKIANQEFYFELVAENADGTLDETLCASWRIAFSDASSGTSAKYETRNGSPAGRLQSAVVSSANQTVDAIFEITLESDEVWFHSKAMNTTAARTSSAAQQYVVPDPSRRYRPRVRVLNLGTAPASSTTVSFYYMTTVDYTEMHTEISGGTGTVQGGPSIPVSMVNNPTVAVAGSPSGAGSGVAKINAAASTNATVVKASSGRLYGYHLANTSAAWRYVKLHNLAAAPVVGTSAVFEVIALPPGGSLECAFTVPVAYATGIAYSIVTGSADTDATAVAAGDVVGALLWL